MRNRHPLSPRRSAFFPLYAPSRRLIELPLSRNRDNPRLGAMGSSPRLAGAHRRGNRRSGWRYGRRLAVHAWESCSTRNSISHGLDCRCDGGQLFGLQGWGATAFVATSQRRRSGASGVMNVLRRGDVCGRWGFLCLLSFGGWCDILVARSRRRVLLSVLIPNWDYPEVWWRDVSPVTGRGGTTGHGRTGAETG